MSFNDSFCDSAFSTNTCAVVTSKQEAGEAAADSNHGDEVKKRFVQLDRTKGGASNCIMDECLHDAAVAKSCLIISTRCMMGNNLRKIKLCLWSVTQYQ